MERDAVPRVSLRWTADGKRKRGRPKETWRRTVEREMKDQNLTWDKIARRASDRENLRTFVEALCTNGCNED